jgi:hypothetical protein
MESILFTVEENTSVIYENYFLEKYTNILIYNNIENLQNSLIYNTQHFQYFTAEFFLFLFLIVYLLI